MSSSKPVIPPVPRTLFLCLSRGSLASAAGLLREVNEETELQRWCSLPPSVVVDCPQETVPLELDYQGEGIKHRVTPPLSSIKGTLIITGNKMIETENEGATQCLNLLFSPPTNVLFHLCWNSSSGGEPTEVGRLFHNNKASFHWTFILSQTQLKVPSRKHLILSIQNPYGWAVTIIPISQNKPRPKSHSRQMVVVDLKSTGSHTQPLHPTASQRRLVELWMPAPFLHPDLNVASCSLLSLLLFLLLSPQILLKSFTSENSTNIGK